MRPILFDKAAATFTSNGLGRLDFISCKVTEERNGIFELEAEISESALHSSQLEMNSIICAPAYPCGSLQAFRVCQITKPITGRFKIYAQHISYQLSLIPVMPFEVTASSGACRAVLGKFISEAVENCPFTFTTDVTTVSSYKQTIPASIKSRMSGVEGSVIDQFGGEWEYDNYNVYLKNHRGRTIPGVTLRYGKNITDLTQEQNIESTITGIVPYWVDSEGGDIVTLPEKSIDSAYAGNYPFKRTTAYDLSSSFEEKPTIAQLRSKAQAYVNQSGIGIPTVSIKVSFIDLAQTEEYKDVAALQNVKLCDYINVEFEKYGISTSAQVVKTVFDVLAERYESIEVGSIRTGLTTTISDANANNIKTITYKMGQAAAETDTKITELSEDVGERIDESVSDLATQIARDYPTKQQMEAEIDNATAWLTGADGVIRALQNQQGEWTDILCCDVNSTATRGNVLRLNVNGIGFSSTGWNGTFTQAWTLDGRLVIGGTNVPSLTVYDNNNNILFQVDANKIIWNSVNTKMNQYGVITTTATSGQHKPYIQLAGGELRFGVDNTYYAKLSEDETGALNLNSDTNVFIQGGFSSSEKPLIANTTDLALYGKKDVEIYSDDGDIIIQSDAGDVSIDGHDRVIIDGGEVDINSCVFVQDNAFLSGKSTNLFNPWDGGKIKFDRLINDNDNNIEIDATLLCIDGNLAMKKGNNYETGYTGRFNLKDSNNNTVTLEFNHGVLVQ